MSKEIELRMKVKSFMENRAKASTEWHKTHVLTKDTLLDFKKFMKKADKEYKNKIKNQVTQP